MSDAAVHITAWQAAGLIDAPTADRLRAAEAGQTGPAEAAEAVAVEGPIVPWDLAGVGHAAASAADDTPVTPRSAAAAMFGPGVTIAEAFAYLGGAFLIAAWGAFTARIAAGDETMLGVMVLIGAGVLSGLGIAIAGRSERASRAAGVAFLVASSSVGAAIASLAAGAGIDWPAAGVISAAVALAAAVALRAIHPTVLTQVGMLGWITGLAAATQAWVNATWFAVDAVPAPDTGTVSVATTGADPMLLVIGSAVFWLGTAVLIALIGLREANAAARRDDPAAARRAAVTRLWAGVTAVLGLASAVTRTADLADGSYGRVLEPWIGSLAILVLSAVLVERAFRRDTTSFIYAAALGMIIALTDFNVGYLSDSTDVALLIEGLILLAVGFGADRLRRRIGRPPATTAPIPDPVEPAEAPA